MINPFIGKPDQLVFYYSVCTFSARIDNCNMFFVRTYGEFVNFSVAACDADCHVVLCLSVLLVLLSAASGEGKTEAQRRYYR